MAERMMDMVKRLFGVSSLETKEGARVKVIVGLGNPGSEYDQTRHNIGFMVLDVLAGRFGAVIGRKKFNALIEEVSDGFNKLLLIKPQQYMNRSGRAVAEAAAFYKLSASDILVVTDDLALDVGRIRLRAQGSAGGHNGLKDILAALGTDAFARLRVGIGSRGTRRGADYVLSRFGADERAVIDQAVKTAADAALCWAREGAETAMTKFNVKAEPDKPQSKER
jgi:peptidyl-tRNA hydrolase, PTH1 family